jgi:hypothetical protein
VFETAVIVELQEQLLV